MTTTRDVSHQSDISVSKMASDGSFVRAPASFRDTIAKGSKFEPEKGLPSDVINHMNIDPGGLDRYHLYVSYACPWAHRTLITRILKGLEDIVGLTVVSPRMGANGWPFANVDAFPGAGEDPNTSGENKSQHIKDIYLKFAPDYTGR